MKSIVVDDEILMIDSFRRTTHGITEIEVVGEFTNTSDAFAYCKDNIVEVVFLDIEIGDESGIDLAKALKKINDKIIIIFISGYSKYIKESNLIGADYYLLKPYKKSEITILVEKIKYLYGRLKKDIRIVTFGKFEVYVNDEIVVFENAKSKELLAFLVDNDGKTVKSEEVFSALWENMNYTHNNAGIYRNTLNKLKNCLKRYDISDLIEISKLGISLNKSKCKCDMFDFFDGDKNARLKYFGEYLNEYSWGEKTNAKLFFSVNNMNFGFDSSDK